MLSCATIDNFCLPRNGGGSFDYYAYDERAMKSMHRIARNICWARLFPALVVASSWGCSSGAIAWRPAPSAVFRHIGLPAQDSKGNEIPRGPRVRAALQPTCGTCAAKSMPKDWAHRIESTTQVLIVFDTESQAVRTYPALRSFRIPILYEPLPDSVPMQLSFLAPGIITLSPDGGMIADDPIQD